MIRWIKLDVEYCEVRFQVVNPSYEDAEPEVPELPSHPACVDWERIQLESDPNGTDLTVFMDKKTLDFFTTKVFKYFEE